MEIPCSKFDALSIKRRINRFTEGINALRNLIIEYDFTEILSEQRKSLETYQDAFKNIEFSSSENMIIIDDKHLEVIKDQRGLKLILQDIQTEAFANASSKSIDPEGEINLRHGILNIIGGVTGNIMVANDTLDRLIDTGLTPR